MLYRSLKREASTEAAFPGDRMISSPASSMDETSPASKLSERRRMSFLLDSPREVAPFPARLLEGSPEPAPPPPLPLGLGGLLATPLVEESCSGRRDE